MRRVIVKLGGHVLADPADLSRQLAGFATELRALIDDGVTPTVVHGAGPQIDRLLRDAGIESPVIGGLRATSDAAMPYVAAAYAGVTLAVVAGLNAAGVVARGIGGPDAGFLRGVARGGAWGRVGTQITVDAAALADHSVVWVICPVAVDATGGLLNCNADEVAGAVAAALGAEALLLASDVPEVRRDPADPASALAVLSRPDAEQLIASGAIRNGMVPKVRAALAAVDAGAARVVICGGGPAGALSAAWRGVGPRTEVVA